MRDAGETGGIDLQAHRPDSMRQADVEVAFERRRFVNLRSKWTFVIWAVILLPLALSQAGAAQLVLYDNFNSKHIDPSKWVGVYDPDILEAVRELAVVPETWGDRHSHPNRSLHISDRAYSATSDDYGSSGGLFGLSFPDPTAITEVSFTVVVNEAEAVGCASNPSQIVTAAEFRGNFFNTEASPTSQASDVVADISLTRTPTDVGSALTVVGFTTLCGDQFCGSQKTLDARVLGYVEPGAAATLRIKWDQPNHRFIYQLDHGTPVFSTYTVSDATPAFFPNKHIGFARVVPHCTSTPRPYTAIDAYFDSVYVNP